MAFPQTRPARIASAPDLRLPLLVSALAPWLIWIAGLTLAIIGWPKGFRFASFVAGAVIGWQVLKLSIPWMYRVARGFLPPGFKAQPGVNYLCFELEYPETAHKLKLYGDELGCIFMDQGTLRMRTSHRDVVIPADRLTMETFRSEDGKPQGLALSWTEQPGAAPTGSVLAVKYVGPDLEVAADYGKKADWAKGVIQGWIQQQSSAPGYGAFSGRQI